ncbi:MAG: carboxymethylenebutenolidase [Chloroflexi bacterium]|nr:carboxymethylenebutenolidase [Chloroflexota bacterium]|tara:strand:+ start:14390 stop:15058 length:669 start_codon:yes stop_codon:yes gene_type:complete
MTDITITHNNIEISGYLSEPEETPTAGIIVIQEWWGLTEDIKEIADRYAAEGYLAFAPDLYHGEIAIEPDEARKLAMSMERDIAAQEIDGAISWLRDEHNVSKAGCVGYCMGGGLTLAAAIRPSSGVDAVHVYYGGGMPSADQIATISVPVLGSYGSEDGGIPVEQVDMLRTTLEDNNIPNDITVYQGAQHSFFNDTRPAYHEQAAMDSWVKSVNWFENYLS